MSQRPPASRPASRSPPDGQRITLPSVQVGDDPQQGGRQPERRSAESEALSFQPHLQLAPQHTRSSQIVQSGENWRSPGRPRDLGVHSILNPTEPEGSGSASRRQSGTSTDSPVSTTGPHPQFGANPSTSTPHTFLGQRPLTNTPLTAEGYSGSFSGPRRILTPKSPSRALSSGRGRNQGTYDAQRSPFLPSRGRGYTTEPRLSSEIPPLPTQQQQQYGFPSASTPSAERRTSMPSMQAQGQAPQSQSASPSISASSLNPSSQTSPASFMYSQGDQALPTTSSNFPSSTFGTSMQHPAGGGALQGLQYQGPSGTTEGPYTAPASTSQGGDSSLHSSSAGSSRLASASDPIQVLTITTSTGQFQRNAGASSRFRQRRKEKEKEASTNIEKLQQQTRELERRVREVEQERDFYRGERDRFRDVVFRTPDMRHLAMQAPPSPLSMRSAPSFPGQGQQLGGPAPTGYQPPPAPERAPIRRIMDAQGEFAPLPYSLPPASTLPTVPDPGFPSGLQQALQSLPPMRREGPAIPATTGPSQPPATAGGSQPPFDPYQRGPYERGWPGDKARR